MLELLLLFKIETLCIIHLELYLTEIGGHIENGAYFKVFTSNNNKSYKFINKCLIGIVVIVIVAVLLSR